MSPRQGHQWPNKKDLSSRKIKEILERTYQFKYYGCLKIGSKTHIPSGGSTPTHYECGPGPILFIFLQGHFDQLMSNRLAPPPHFEAVIPPLGNPGSVADSFKTLYKKINIIFTFRRGQSLCLKAEKINKDFQRR